MTDTQIENIITDGNDEILNNDESHSEENKLSSLPASVDSGIMIDLMKK